MNVVASLLLALLVALAQSLGTQAQDQSGFISLICGSPPNTNFTDSTTTIIYTSDSKFIDIGKGKPIQPEYRYNGFPQLSHVRSFPEGNRSCYSFNLTKGDQYLIRAYFHYGNYDGLEKFPTFEMHLGSNLWQTLGIDRSYSNLERPDTIEIIHVVTSSLLQICLVKIDDSVPFISSLELRHFRDRPYRTENGSLIPYDRYDVGQESEDLFRYGIDYYDRIWSSSYYKPEWTSINTTSFSQDASGTYKPPYDVMSTASIPTNTTEPMNVTTDASDINGTMLCVMYFAEIDSHAYGREFNIFYNEKLYGPITPSYTTIVYNITLLDGKHEILLVKTENSKFPPLLNAIEYFSFITFPLSDTDEKEAEAMRSIKMMYRLSKISWQGDPCAPRKYSWEGINCTYNNNDPPKIISLNLSSSGLRGQIPPYISNLTNLRILDLSNNNLRGSIPDFLSGMKSLTFLNLSHNNLSGEVPVGLIERQKKGSLTLRLEGNDLCDSCKKKKIIIVSVVALAGSLLLAAAFVTVLFFRSKKPKNLEGRGYGHVGPSRSDGSNLVTNNRSFSYSEVQKMTNNFDTVLGKGGFGIVYLGSLGNTQVAVKILSQTSSQGYKEFQTEVELLLRVHHRNLTGLVGYCHEGDKMVLIYEFMANGDLRENLSGQRGTHILSWEDRLRIALESAQGLEYLHHGCTPPIVHRDIKSTNILLNEQFKAKLADFGLSRSFPLGGQAFVSTVVAGTPGYLDPDYYRTNWLTEKSDVYSFGIVILDLITNKPVIDQKRKKAHIGEWVSLMLGEGDIMKIVDPRLQNDVDTNSVWKVAEIAMSCIRQSSGERPSMADVVSDLKECLGEEMARMQRSSKTDYSTDSAEVALFSQLNPEAR